MESGVKSMAVLLCLAVLLVGVAVGMTDDGQMQLQVALQSNSDSPHITRIAPKTLAERANDGNDDSERDIHTFVQELRAAGVQTAGNKDLETLSYKQLAQLLAVWHLTQERNFYEAAADGESVSAVVQQP